MPSRPATGFAEGEGRWYMELSCLGLTLTDEMLFRLFEGPCPRTRSRQHLAGRLACLRSARRRSRNTKPRRQTRPGLSRRNKHRFAAQEMLVLLAQLAHNLVVWTRNDLAQADQRLQKYGIQRTVRDALRIPGYIHVNDQGDVMQVTLNERHHWRPLSPSVCQR